MAPTRRAGFALSIVACATLLPLAIADDVVALSYVDRPPIRSVLTGPNGQVLASSDGNSAVAIATAGITNPGSTKPGPPTNYSPPPIVPLGTSFEQVQPDSMASDPPESDSDAPPPSPRPLRRGPTGHNMRLSPRVGGGTIGGGQLPRAPATFIPPPAPRPPLGPPSDGCTSLLANVPLNCPNYQGLISELGSDLNPSQEVINAAAIKYKPTEACCSAWRGFYASHDGKLGCGCSWSILSQSTAYGVTQAGFEQVYKAVSKACAYLGGGYASGFYNPKCPKIVGYN